MPTQDSEFIRFLKAYPTYPSTETIDKLRSTEYARLDAGEHIYLDYTGGGIYAESQIRKHHQMLRNMFTATRTHPIPRRSRPHIC